MFSSPALGEANEGCSSHPIVLEAVSILEMDSFVKVVEARAWAGPPLSTYAEWKAALHLATMYELSRIRFYIISQIDLEQNVNPVERIELANKCCVWKWLHPAYTTLCVRLESISAEEGARLGLPVFIALCHVREQHLRDRLAGMARASRIGGRVDSQPEGEAIARLIMASDILKTPSDTVSSPPMGQNPSVLPPPKGRAGPHPAIARLVDKLNTQTMASRASNLNASPPYHQPPTHPSSSRRDPPLDHSLRTFFRVDNYVYSISRPVLLESNHFRTMLSNAIRGGGSATDPIVLTEVSVFEMDNFVKVLEARGLEQGRRSWAGPPLFNYAEWRAALYPATVYEFNRVRDYIISLIDLEQDVDPVERIELANKCRVWKWLHPAYITLCTRIEPISIEEGARLGLSVSVALCHVREQCLRARLARGPPSTNTSPFVFGTPSARWRAQANSHSQEEEAGAEKAATARLIETIAALNIPGGSPPPQPSAGPRVFYSPFVAKYHLEMDRKELETYQVQLSQVELALVSDPSNAELTSLRSELKELISLTETAIAQAEAAAATASSSKSKSSAANAVSSTAFAAGDDCLAKYSGDGKWYPARITSIGGAEDRRVYSVVFKGYNSTELVAAGDVKVLPPSYNNNATHPNSNKRKPTKEEEEEAARKKKKNEKRLEVRAQKAAEQNSKQAAWQKFAKKGEKKGVVIAGLQGKSIFQSPDNPHGKADNMTHTSSKRTPEPANWRVRSSPRVNDGASWTRMKTYSDVARSNVAPRSEMLSSSSRYWASLPCPQTNFSARRGRAPMGSPGHPARAFRDQAQDKYTSRHSYPVEPRNPKSPFQRSRSPYLRPSPDPSSQETPRPLARENFETPRPTHGLPSGIEFCADLMVDGAGGAISRSSPSLGTPRSGPAQRSPDVRSGLGTPGVRIAPDPDYKAFEAGLLAQESVSTPPPIDLVVVKSAVSLKGHSLPITRLDSSDTNDKDTSMDDTLLLTRFPLEYRDRSREPSFEAEEPSFCISAEDSFQTSSNEASAHGILASIEGFGGVVGEMEIVDDSDLGNVSDDSDSSCSDDEGNETSISTHPVLESSTDTPILHPSHRNQQQSDRLLRPFTPVDDRSPAHVASSTNGALRPNAYPITPIQSGVRRGARPNSELLQPPRSRGTSTSFERRSSSQLFIDEASDEVLYIPATASARTPRYEAPSPTPSSLSCRSASPGVIGSEIQRSRDLVSPRLEDPVLLATQQQRLLTALSSVVAANEEFPIPCPPSGKHAGSPSRLSGARTIPLFSGLGISANGGYQPGAPNIELREDSQVSGRIPAFRVDPPSSDDVFGDISSKPGGLGSPLGLGFPDRLPMPPARASKARKVSQEPSPALPDILEVSWLSQEGGQHKDHPNPATVNDAQDDVHLGSRASDTLVATESYGGSANNPTQRIYFSNSPGERMPILQWVALPNRIITDCTRTPLGDADDDADVEKIIAFTMVHCEREARVSRESKHTTLPRPVEFTLIAVFGSSTPEVPVAPESITDEPIAPTTTGSPSQIIAQAEASSLSQNIRTGGGVRARPYERASNVARPPSANDIPVPPSATHTSNPGFPPGIFHDRGQPFTPQAQFVALPTSTTHGRPPMGPANTFGYLPSHYPYASHAPHPQQYRLYPPPTAPTPTQHTLHERRRGQVPHPVLSGAYQQPNAYAVPTLGTPFHLAAQGSGYGQNRAMTRSASPGRIR
ncbi:hypothetical protein FRB99_008495 [Tulasnella sp. 403]|nr:hypothetical protein FRB99_008495 [Tulasnella sp. 403]